MPADQTNSPQQLGMMQLDKKLNFEKHLSKVESMVNKIIGINCRLQHGQTPRSALLTIYRQIIPPRLDYEDQAFN